MRSGRILLSKFRNVETLDTVSGKKGLMQKLLCSRRVTYLNIEKQTRVEVLPLVHLNVSPLYVKRILAGLGTAQDFSTVYLGSPFVTASEKVEEITSRSYSFKTSLTTSLTVDFPKIIPIFNVQHSPTFSPLFTQNDRISFLRGGLGELPNLCKELNKTAHDSDTICILATPRLLEVIDNELSVENGWKVENDTRMEIGENLNHTYGLFLNVLCGVVRVCFGILFVFMIPKIMNFFVGFVEANKADQEAREVPVEEIIYFSGDRDLEQQTFLVKIREKMLTSPPGAGVDNRKHTHFWDRPLTWENISYPKPLMAYREKTTEEESNAATGS